MVEKIWGVKFSDIEPLISRVTLTGTDLPSLIIRGVIICGASVTCFVVAHYATFSPILRRLQAFEDILTIAKAYRKEPGETTKPPAALLPTVTS